MASVSSFLISNKILNSLLISIHLPQDARHLPQDARPCVSTSCLLPITSYLLPLLLT